MLSKLRWHNTKKNLNHTIAGALINCFNCPNVSDAEDGIEIAQEIKKKSKLYKSHWGFIRKNAKVKQFQLLDADYVTDFP